jgi:phage N-6-adenine-methyltransferase
MNHKPEPDTTLDHAPWSASPPRGAQLDGGALTEQLQMFATPQISRTSDDYWTPKWLFDALGVTFDLDVACPPEGPMHTPCNAYYTQQDNALIQPWYGRVWMNPPYSKPSPWINKFVKHANGIALTVVSKSKWFDMIWSHPDIRFVVPNQTFAFEQGRIPWPLALWAIGDSNIEAIAKIGRVR